MGTVNINSEIYVDVLCKGLDRNGMESWGMDRRVGERKVEVSNNNEILVVAICKGKGRRGKHRTGKFGRAQERKAVTLKISNGFYFWG